ncbi:MAG: glycosyltransferase family 39 protein [Elainellaceae cyanobacterium]
MIKSLRFPVSLVAMFAVVVALGIFFRVAHLDQKVYWHDEVFTSLRSAGYIGDDVEQALFTGEVMPARQLLTYQTLDPERGWDDTLASLKTHPEHPPLYYLAVRFWMERFGSGIAVTRSLAVIFGLLCLPALYWLCRELFATHVLTVAPGWTTGLAIALLSLSPVHVLYAQEARQYSLWTLGISLSCATLLRSLRRQRWGDWMLYGLTLILSLYTTLFSGLVMLAQGLYVVGLLVAQWRSPSSSPTKTSAATSAAIPVWRSLGGWVGANLLAVVAFAPWIMVMVQNWLQFKAKTQWTRESPPLDYLMKLWGLHFSSNVIDPGLPLDHPFTYIVPPLVLVLLGVALWVLVRTTPLHVWLLIGLLTILPAIALILPDVLTGGQRSASTRYFFPSLLGMILAIAYLLAFCMTHAQRSKQRLGYGLTALLLTTGLISCSISFQAQTWWSKGVSYGVPFAAAALNDLPSPLVIIGYQGVNLGNSIALSYWVSDQVQFQLVKDSNVPDLPPGVSDRFLFYPNNDLLTAFEQNPEWEAVPFEQDSVPLLRVQAK